MFENLIFDWAVPGTDVKKLLKIFANVVELLMYFLPLLTIDGVPLLFCFSDTRDLMPILVFIEKNSETVFSSPYKDFW